MVATGSGGLTFVVNAREVDAMMQRGEMALAPQSMAFFLSNYVEPQLHRRARERFRKEGDEVSGKWAALRPATQAIRGSMGYGESHPINVRTGQMENFITAAPGQINVGVMGGASLTLPGSEPTGQLEEKIRTAQMGKDSPDTVPRPVLGLGVRDLEETMVAMGSYLTRVISAGRLGSGRVV